MEKKLPKLEKSNITGITSSELLSSVLSEFSIVIPIPTEKDLGIDMRRELLKEGVPTGLHYNIQCKGTEKVDENLNHYSIAIKVKTINYWLQQREPTFLIVVDRESSSFYWEYPARILKDRINNIQNQESVLIKVNKENKIKNEDRFLPTVLLNDIYQYHYDLLDKAVGILELELNERIEKTQKISGIDSYLSIADSLQELLSSVALVENLNENLVKKITNVIELEIFHFRDALGHLDSIAEVRRYIKGSIWEDEGFISGKTPQTIMDNLDDCWEKYVNNGYKSIYLKELDSALKELLKLNQQLTYFLYEVAIESDPSGNHDYILERYNNNDSA